MAFGLIVAVVIGGAWFLWYKYHLQIAAGIIAVQNWEMRLIGLFTERYKTLDTQTLMLNPSTVSATTLFRLCHLVGLFFRLPAAALVAILALLCLTRAAPSRFTRCLDLDRLINVQAEVFPTLAVVAGRRLKPVLLAERQVNPLDPALHVTEWVDRHARDVHDHFDEHRARQELACQLGPIWSGPERARPVVRCLFAAFVLHAMRDRDGATRLLGDLAGGLPRDRSEGPEGPTSPIQLPPDVIAQADAILVRTKVDRTCWDVASRHGFTTPALMSVLCEARRKAGVLPPAQFKSVKFVDRRLWYALHSLGFPSDAAAPMPNPRVEAIGARDHWASECQAGRPLLVPAIDHAVLAIRAALLAAGNEQTEKEAS